MTKAGLRDQRDVTFQRSSSTVERSIQHPFAIKPAKAQRFWRWSVKGWAITILPRKVLPDKLEGITGIPLDPPRSLQIGLAVRLVASASPAARLFVQTAVAWVQEQAILLPSAR